MIFDSRPCELGEGALWHPERHQLFWFDILGKELHTAGRSGQQSWNFDGLVSAAGWVSHDRLLVAGERELFLFDLESEEIETLVELEAGNVLTRSNDGRADRHGGFWIGTMGKRGGQDPGMGSIYRWYRGEVRTLFTDMTIPNSICFAPDGQTAYFSDTVTQRISQVALDPDGWPTEDARVFADLAADGVFPDGATVDAAGNLWNAQWGAGRVACYSPQGNLVRSVSVGAPHSSCPAFGGPDLTTLFVTTAREDMDATGIENFPLSGQTFCIPHTANGLPEPRVII